MGEIAIEMVWVEYRCSKSITPYLPIHNMTKKWDDNRRPWGPFQEVVCDLQLVGPKSDFESPGA